MRFVLLLGALALAAAGAPALATSLADQNATAQGAIDGRSSASAAQNTVYSCTFTTVTVPSSIPSYVSSSGVVSFASKPSISGTVSWTSYYKAVVSGTARLLLGNGLPSHTTGSFPSKLDPNSISAARIYGSIPASPNQASSPTCLSSGPVGVAFTGAVFYNPLNSQGYDAIVNEEFDLCEGHPETTGQYHYHHASPCATDNGSASQHSTQVGYALDGFGIYGPWGNAGAKVTNSDLDVCHGHTHSVTDITGATSSVYHYHTNEAFPYVLGCYRGTAIRLNNLTTPDTGFYWTSSASGRGFGLEVQGSSMFLGAYTYDSSGADIWYVGNCTLTTTTCSDTLYAYSGGTTLSNLGVSSSAPTGTTAYGSFTVTVSSSSTSTVTISITPTGGSATSYSLTRFPIGGSSVQSAPSWGPQTGWWWSSSYSGTGWFIENQGTTTSGSTTYSNIFMVGYAYGSTYTTGQGNWYAPATGQNVQSSSSTSSWSGTLYEYVNGPTLTGSSGSTTQYASKGTATIQFTSTTTATLTLPNGKSVSLQRYTIP